MPTRVIFPENKNSISSLNKNPTSPAGTMAIKILIIYDLLVLFSLSNNPLIKSYISFLNTRIVLKAVAKCKTDVINKLSDGS